MSSYIIHRYSVWKKCFDSVLTCRHHFPATSLQNRKYFEIQYIQSLLWVNSYLYFTFAFALCIHIYIFEELWQVYLHLPIICWISNIPVVSKTNIYAVPVRSIWIIKIRWLKNHGKVRFKLKYNMMFIAISSENVKDIKDCHHTNSSYKSRG